MSLVLLAELAAKSFIVSGVALALLALLKRRSAAERSWVAHAALVIFLALPVASLALPKLYLFQSPPPLAQGAPIAATTAISASLAPLMQTPAIDPAVVLQVLYALGAGLLLIASLVAVLRLSLLRRGAAVVVEAEWLTALARAQRRMGVKYGAALLASNALSSPVSWGMLRPTILLNENLLPRHGDAEAIIAHELAHVARFDWAKLLIARIVTALFWFNPLVWILARQCHQLREEAADDAVLRSDVPSADYAALLVQAARHECRSGLIAAHGVAPSKGSLHQRVTRVLDGTLRRVPAPAGWAIACLTGATLAAGPLAALTLEAAPRPASEATTIAASPNRAAPSHAITLRSGFERSEKAEKPEKREKPEMAERPERLERPETVTIRSQGFLPADVGDLVAATIRGQSSAETRAALAKAGYDKFDDQVGLSAIGVTPAYIADLSSVGYKNLSADDLAGLWALGVTPAYIADLAAVGYAGLSVDDLAGLKALGVNASFVRRAQSPGAPKLTLDQLKSLRVQ